MKDTDIAAARAALVESDALCPVPDSEIKGPYGNPHRQHLRAVLARVDVLERERDEARRELSAATMDASIGAAVIAVLRGEPVSDFEESFGPVMEAQQVRHLADCAGAYATDVNAQRRTIVEACALLRVTDDAEEDWPRLPLAIVQIVAERDELRATLANELGTGDPPSPGWERNDIEPGETTWYRRCNTDGTEPPEGHDDDDQTRVCWVYRSRVDDAPTTEGDAHDTARPWRWEVEQVTHRATRQVSGLVATARDGMRLADEAVKAGRPE